MALVSARACSGPCCLDSLELFVTMPDLSQTPTLEERLLDLKRIAGLTDPVLRNLLITQRYHDLSHALAGVLGRADANWATFATWASKTAGRSIREEDVPPELTEFLRAKAHLDERFARFYRALGPLSRFAPKLDPREVAQAVLQEVASQIAKGNLRVYAELAPLFAEFACFSDEAQRTDAAFDQFLAKLKPGAADRGGQDALRLAFSSYYRAAHCADQAQRSQLVLLGNVMIGLHEQTRLQDNIAGALNAPFSEAVYVRFGAAGPRFLHPLFRALLRGGVRLFARGLAGDWKRLATRFLMKLATPNGDEISLGQDLPPERFDLLLTKLTNTELIAVLTRYDAHLETTRGSAAIDWTVLQHRMRFIADLFRVGQRDPSWFDPPFADAQRMEFEAGRVPGGRL